MTDPIIVLVVAAAGVLFLLAAQYADTRRWFAAVCASLGFAAITSYLGVMVLIIIYA